MAEKNKVNPFDGNLQKIVDESTLALLSCKPGVVNQASLPSSGNTTNDARITNDTHNLFIWNGTIWTDQGDLFNLNWGSMIGTLSDQTDLQSALDAKQNSLPNINKSNIQFVISPKAPITTGIKGRIQIPFSATINEVTLIADPIGSIVIDIWKNTFINLPLTVSDSITASDKPTIVSDIKANNAVLTGWNVTINEDDILYFNVDSVSTIETLTIILKITRT